MDYETKAESLETSFAAFNTQTTDTGGNAAPVAARAAHIKPDNRPQLSGVKAADVNPVRTSFVNGYLRKGMANGVELKSIDAASMSDGGYAIPIELDSVIAETLRNVSPIRQIANVVQVGSAGYRKLVTSSSSMTSGWGAETLSRSQTNTPVFNQVAPAMGDLYANPAASQAMLDDAAFDIEGWLAQEIAREFARAEGAAFVNGTGSNMPLGFLASPTSTLNDTTRLFGTLQYLATGVDAAFPTTTPENMLMDVVQLLRQPYRQGAVWVMSPSTLNKIRKFRTADGDLLWQTSLSDPRATTLLGYPVLEAADMPDIASGSYSIAFGNFQEGYIIAERAQTNILRDPYTNKPFVNFYAHKRIGGCVSNSEAIKLVKFGVS
jgi:HK97 family phage major capsid protein